MASSTEITSTATTSGKTEPENGYPAGNAPPPLPNFFGMDVTLRLLLFASSLSALVVMVTSKETDILIPTLLPPPYPSFLYKDIKFNYSPAFIYLVAALGVTCIYSIITFLASACVISKRSPSAKMLFILAAHDALMVGILASATGSAGAVGYIGLKGNSHAGWNKICNHFGKFCRYVVASAALSLTSSILLVLLVLLSAYSLYRRSR